MPATYIKDIGYVGSVFHKELTARKYSVTPAITTNSEIDNFYGWLEKTRGEEVPAFFMHATFEGPEVDELIQDMILKLSDDKLLENTHIIMTGLHSAKDTIPMIWFTPERRAGEITHDTTLYDVIPSLMARIWECENVYSAGVGRPLSKPGREWFVQATRNGFRIVDLKQDGFISVENNVVNAYGDARLDLVFPALKLLMKNYNPY